MPALFLVTIFFSEFIRIFYSLNYCKTDSVMGKKQRMKDMPAKGKKGGNWHTRKTKVRTKMRRKF